MLSAAIIGVPLPASTEGGPKDLIMPIGGDLEVHTGPPNEAGVVLRRGSVLEDAHELLHIGTTSGRQSLGVKVAQDCRRKVMPATQRRSHLRQGLALGLHAERRRLSTKSH